MLSDTALIEDVAFEERGIRPAFFRVSAAWKEEAREEEALLAVLQSRGIEAGIEAASLEPIYRKPAYRAQYGETPKATCPVAERQADRRLSLTFSP